MFRSGNELSVRILDSLLLESYMTVDQLIDRMGGAEESRSIYNGLAKLHDKHLVEKKQLPGELLQFKKLIN